MSDNRDECIEKMTEFVTRMKEIMDLIGEKDRLFGEEQQKAQSLMKSLKEDLKSESKRMGSVKGHEKLSRIERAVYFPAIKEACAHLKVKWNSIPNDHWMSKLYESKLDIEHLLRDLKK